MKKRILCFIVCLLFVFGSWVLLPQATVMIGEEYRNVDLEDIRTDLYLPGDETNRMFFTPFFLFKSTSDGKLDVRLEDPLLPSGDWSVKLFLLISPAQKLDLVVEHIKAELNQNSQVLTPKHKRYLTIQRGWLIPIPMLNLRIRGVGQGSIFTFEKLTKSALQDYAVISADLDEAHARRLYRLLLDDKRSLEFIVNYTLNASVRTKSAASGTSIDFYETDAVKDLTGAGKAFEMSVRTSGTIKQSETLVTRKQRDSFIGSIRNEIEINYKIQNPKDEALLQKTLDDYFKKVFKEKNVLIEDFAIEFKKLSAYDFDPQDVSPDKISKITADVKNFFEKEEKHHINANVSASADVCGIFSGSMRGNYTKTDYQNIMTDQGWKFGVKGNFTVPKSLELYVVNKKRLKRELSVKVSILRISSTIQESQASITTLRRFCPQLIEDYKSKFERISSNLVVAPNGNVGIKTSDPKNKLHVKSNGESGGITISVDSKNEDHSAILSFEGKKGEQNTSTSIIYYPTTQSLIFNQNGWEAYLTGDGSFCIGGYRKDYATGLVNRMLQVWSQDEKDLARFEGPSGWIDFNKSGQMISSSGKIIFRVNENEEALTIEDNTEVTVHHGLNVKDKIYLNGNLIHGDYVFEPDFNLIPLEKQNEFMMNNKHLPNVPRRKVNKEGKEVMELGKHIQGLTVELEKAHLYIQILNKRLLELENSSK